MEIPEDIYEITIIGGGPTGLFAAFYAGLRQARTKIIDSLPQLGGQLTTLYPEKEIYDIPGFTNIKAAKLIENLTNQIAPYNQTICLNEEVTHLVKEKNYFHIETTKNSHYSKAVIISTGNGAFQPCRLSIANAEKFENTAIYYSIDQLNQFKHKRIAVAGGGDTAMDWALMLESIASEVSIIHRRTKFRGHEYSVEQLKNSNITIYTPYTIEQLLVNEQNFQGIRLKKVKSTQPSTIDLTLDALIVSYGFVSSQDYLNNWGLDTQQNTIKVSSNMQTSIEGIYAIGDICYYDGKVKLITTGFGEAPTAVNNALHFIRPDEKIQPRHSTSLKNNR